MPTVETSILLCAMNGSFVLAIDADDDGAQVLHGLLAERADVGMDIGDAAATKGEGGIGKAPALVSVRGDADRYARGDGMKLAIPKLLRGGANAGGLFHVIGQESEYGIRGAERLETAECGAEAAAFILVEEPGEAEPTAGVIEMVERLGRVLRPGVDFRNCRLPIGEIFFGNTGDGCFCGRESGLMVVVQI